MSEQLMCASCGGEVAMSAAFCPACGVPTGPPTHEVEQATGSAISVFWPPRLGQVWSLVGASLREVFKRHPRGAAETALDPRIAAEQGDVSPAPWVYSRVLLYLVSSFLLLSVVFAATSNLILVPSALFLGAAGGPVAMALFLYESNLPRNITLFRFLVLFAAGGFFSILAGALLYQMNPLGISAAASLAAPFIEEPVKLAIVVLLTRAATTRWILNGLVFGAAVGAGFAVLETAGYLYWVVTDTGDFTALTSLAGERGTWSFGTHAAWTAILAAALWQVMNGRTFDWNMLKDQRFLIPLGVVVALHLVWNSPPADFLPLRPVIALVSLFMVLSYLVAGREQYQASGDST